MQLRLWTTSSVTAASASARSLTLSTTSSASQVRPSAASSVASVASVAAIGSVSVGRTAARGRLLPSIVMAQRPFTAGSTAAAATAATAAASIASGSTAQILMHVGSAPSVSPAATLIRQHHAAAAQQQPLLHSATAQRLRGLVPARSFSMLSAASANVATAAGAAILSIDDVTMPLTDPLTPEFVPLHYIQERVRLTSPTMADHLRWMMQKDLLGQDMFLIGPPGPLRRNLAMVYCELTRREVEYVSLSRDTTESDLKQRREIRSGSAHYIDQAAVLAAVHGRILILEGIEKAERNVLPVLNNLLENREMRLEDGRFLVAPQRYDALLKEHSKEELDKWKLVRVSERFRVIALGLPVPRFQGNPLDPPLRSRFQGRDVRLVSFDAALEYAVLSAQRALHALATHQTVAQGLRESTASSSPADELSHNSSTSIPTALPDLPANLQARIRSIVALGTVLRTLEGSGSFEIAGAAEASAALNNKLPDRLPEFPMDSINSIANLLALFPALPTAECVHIIYPFTLILGAEAQQLVLDTMKRLKVGGRVLTGYRAGARSATHTADSTVSIKDPYKLETVERLLPGSATAGQVPVTRVSFQLDSAAVSSLHDDFGSSDALGPIDARFLGGQLPVVPAAPVQRLEASSDGSMPTLDAGFIEVPYHRHVLLSLLRSHAVSDICLVGGKGVGKSLLVRHLATLLGYEVEPIMLYQDMTARDLLQQRTTLPNGDTVWNFSHLINAALHGHLAVLDGIHRLNADTLAMLQRLVQDRDIVLHDGTRLLRHDRFDELCERRNLTPAQLNDRGVRRIHESFRIIALAEPVNLPGVTTTATALLAAAKQQEQQSQQSTPPLGQRAADPAKPGASGSTPGAGKKWLSPETLSMFHFYALAPLNPVEEAQVIRGMVHQSLSPAVLDKLLDFAHRLRSTATNHTVLSLSASLSTRQLVRICRRLANYPDESLYEAIHRACMSRFLPQLARETLERLLEADNIRPAAAHSPAEAPSSASVVAPSGHQGRPPVERHVVTLPDGKQVQKLRIGTLEVVLDQNLFRTTDQLAHGSVSTSTNALETPTSSGRVLVPDVLFYDNPQHTRVMADMLKDLLLGENLLLVSNQGTGKNKVTDRLLHLLGRPREYIQLHRDTTVQTLTLQPTIREGVIEYEDSPLVRAVMLGHVLVVDEADKAPTHVTCVLKALAESGEMALADGRRIVSRAGLRYRQHGDTIDPMFIPMHPDFRMIVLANRPGFPFLGNDFFAALGDMFSCHVMENPDTPSELAMLRQYAPNVSEDVLRRLTAAFNDLRHMVDEGQLTYPYSTRELVNIVRHLEKYPDEGIGNVVRSVFDFDSYDPELRQTLVSTLQRHGIPVGVRVTNVKISSEHPLPAPVSLFTASLDLSDGTQRRSCIVKTERIAIKGPLRVSGTKALPFDHVREARTQAFSEIVREMTIDLMQPNRFCAIAVSPHNGTVHTITDNPVGLYSFPCLPEQITASATAAGTLPNSPAAAEQLATSTTLRVSANHFSHMDLYDLYPFFGARAARELSMVALDGAFAGCVLILERNEMSLSLVAPHLGTVHTLSFDSPLQASFGRMARLRSLLNPARPGGTNAEPMAAATLVSTLAASHGLVAVYRAGLPHMDVLDLIGNEVTSVELPSKLVRVDVLYDKSANSAPVWLVRCDRDADTAEPTDYILDFAQLQKRDRRVKMHPLLSPIAVAPTPEVLLPANPLHARRVTSHLPAALAANVILHATGTAPSASSASVGPALVSLDDSSFVSTVVFGAASGSKKATRFSATNWTYLRESSQPSTAQLVVDLASLEAARSPATSSSMLALTAASRDGLEVLEAVDLARQSYREIDLSRNESDTGNRLDNSTTRALEDRIAVRKVLRDESPAGMRVVGMATLPNGWVAALHADGLIRIVETDLASLERSLHTWRLMVGRPAEERSREVRITIDRPSGKDVTSPKHGKVDPKNEPHVGGNQWAGGTGGRDTAGLGGKGGPYRLDAGHTVHQVPQVEKDAVPPEVSAAAREMGRQAFEKRLAELNMSEHDAELYEKFAIRVRKEVRELRVTLNSVEAKGQERVWLKNQTMGDIDDNRLIEGLTGEKNIYRRRGEQLPEPGAPQQHPKRMRFVMDVSGSMYRFNGFDGRLDRMLEAALMIMESFAGFEHKFSYELIGHSGDGPDIQFVPMQDAPSRSSSYGSTKKSTSSSTGSSLEEHGSRGKMPKTDKDRLRILQTMHAHAQYCISGDHTLEATRLAVDTLAKVEEADDRLVVVLSDANLDRYGIRPSVLANAMNAHENVNAFAVFIGSLGDQADFLAKNLPLGKGFVCMNTADIPKVMKQIFTTTMLQSRL
ncbi:hypothetical protein CAOG_08496 [Capsaspora owczarzaki ATCC 30864]|uniref:hypothetical protein n=1 Tax=Capsaspora owczarzaki (strain ATCC 30864) TaxID=595528 RepID=UPI0003523C64|nr:hypothetical protein CAOG_08496 [Capsaspora owczarzaki ATCC 30864]|eukprot:XP_011270078.1 hypothetical protein CAOG_08496 [Capsaspora owczarzaki ATCC 30864]